MMTVTDLDCLRGQRRVLSGVSFALDAGDCLILRGPNGAGKTTLLRTLAGLSPAPRGALSTAPEDLVYTGHLDAVKPQLTVAENLTFWQGIYQNAPQDTLNSFDLDELADRPAATLSAGQKRRLGLARLHVSGRKIWLLDEPTTALDADHVARFTDTLQAHCNGGGIAIISTHLDIALPQARTLNVADFAARQDRTADEEADPFLQGAY
ncbi:heme ABC exporter ATP-binding protein CcmA [Neptunicoccus cionae]|uniref:Cytochrome c biogenesis ATP-binding export protein CcmA n=1 Tax=Neptunicoccus cionae TaxID=2035344 RepID=A0A916QXI6_9RHOB|nr:heme ABC exporter ATP-binding protein CcmA [Amylibacter cionae]GGA21480.1 cytochrome c biogenesis ATP-binding export protein CcmA [Amylibacter cionae]